VWLRYHSAYVFFACGARADLRDDGVECDAGVACDGAVVAVDVDEIDAVCVTNGTMSVDCVTPLAAVVASTTSRV